LVNKTDGPGPLGKLFNAMSQERGGKSKLLVVQKAAKGVLPKKGALAGKSTCRMGAAEGGHREGKGGCLKKKPGLDKDRGKGGGRQGPIGNAMADFGKNKGPKGCLGASIRG